MCLCCRDWDKKDKEKKDKETKTELSTRTQTKTQVTNVTRTPTNVTRNPTIALRTAMPNNTVIKESLKKTDADVKATDAQITAMIYFVEETVKKGIDGLKKEYDKLNQSKTLASAAFKTNMVKNRYGNIPCFDFNRVKLECQNPSESDYIHANRFESKLLKLKSDFILTQGPIDRTIDDFWRMVWQEKPKFIVMLCRLMENEKQKCSLYWPEKQGESKTYGKVTVTNEGDGGKHGEQVFDIEQFQVCSEGEEIHVKHIRWLDWPDFGIPKSGLGMLRVLRKIEQDSGTAIVHCSAGIGRTGTLLGAEITMKALQAGKRIKVPDVVHELRAQRFGMVQTVSQYIYLHFSLCTYCERKLKDVPSAAEYMTRLKHFFTAYKDYANSEEMEDRKLVKSNQPKRGETTK